MLHDLFERQVTGKPDHPAVISATGRLSYEQLSHRSNQTGRLLQKKGVKPNHLVAVVMEKGWEQVVAVLGILKSGAAYIPINPEIPGDRLNHILKDANVRFVLTQSWLKKKLGWPQSVECISINNLDFSERSSRIPNPAQNQTDLAYVIYTSGSTGVPKGVMIDHRGAVNTIVDINERFGIGAEDKVFALSDLSFDLSVFDIFGTLAAGATIVMPNSSGTKDPAHWLQLINREQVTVWNSVPALMGMLAAFVSGQTDLFSQALRLIMLSGDRIPCDLPEKIRTLFQNISLISLGGATEASIWSIIYPIENIDPNWESIPYGRPMKNQRFYVLNDAMENCPDWVQGQLYIGGAGLAKGYWKDEEKTKKVSSCIPKPENGYTVRVILDAIYLTATSNS